MKVGVNLISFGPGASPESLSRWAAFAENEAVVIVATDAQGAAVQYWIRCLPSDFPVLTVAHPNPGGPTPGWYLVNGKATSSDARPYVMVLDTNGTTGSVANLNWFAVR